MRKEELIIEIEAIIKKHDYIEFRELNLLLIKIYDALNENKIKVYNGQKKQ
jgi:hypothetical protein